MAQLSSNDRAAICGDFARLRLGLTGLTKADLRAAVDALDDYFNTNAAAINSAIPQPARGALTQSQKARLLVHVIEKRYQAGA